MKEGIHPKYVQAEIVCACGNKISIGSTRETVNVETCSKCHPFFTGTKKLLDSAGRVERFARMVEKGKAARASRAAKKAPKLKQKKAPAKKAK